MVRIAFLLNYKCIDVYEPPSVLDHSAEKDNLAIRYLYLYSLAEYCMHS